MEKVEDMKIEVEAEMNKLKEFRKDYTIPYYTFNSETEEVSKSVKVSFIYTEDKRMIIITHDLKKEVERFYDNMRRVRKTKEVDKIIDNQTIEASYELEDVERMFNQCMRTSSTLISQTVISGRISKNTPKRISDAVMTFMQGCFLKT